MKKGETEKRDLIGDVVAVKSAFKAETASDSRFSLFRRRNRLFPADSRLSSSVQPQVEPAGALTNRREIGDFGPPERSKRESEHGSEPEDARSRAVVLRLEDIHDERYVSLWYKGDVALSYGMHVVVRGAVARSRGSYAGGRVESCEPNEDCFAFQHLIEELRKPLYGSHRLFAHRPRDIYVLGAGGGAWSDIKHHIGPAVHLEKVSVSFSNPDQLATSLGILASRDDADDIGVLISRGGGDDLYAIDAEVVARALAKAVTRVPIVFAVGHTYDTPLVGRLVYDEYVCANPTKGAELIARLSVHDRRGQYPQGDALKKAASSGASGSTAEMIDGSNRDLPPVESAARGALPHEEGRVEHERPILVSDNGARIAPLAPPGKVLLVASGLLFLVGLFVETRSPQHVQAPRQKVADAEQDASAPDDPRDGRLHMPLSAARGERKAAKRRVRQGAHARAKGDLTTARGPVMDGATVPSPAPGPRLHGPGREVIAAPPPTMHRAESPLLGR